uniref:ENPP1-3/EXOG-like endonuclease/phosphodiesterase domain-containing protein n=1 Tax=Strigamia maritima TaxID=126957 RepID=T1IHY3_STRMM
MRYLTTTAIALSGYLQKWRHSNLFKVNAQPSHPRDEDEETECLHPAKRVKYEFNSPEKAEYKPPSLQECLDERKRNIAKAAAINREIFAKHANFGTQNLNYQYGGAIFPHPKVAKRFLIEYDDFILCYDNTTRVPCWTLEEITGESGELSMMAKPRPYDREESWVPHEFRTGLRHYQYAFDMIKLQHLAEFDIHPEGVGDPCVYTNVVAQRIEDNDHSVRTLWDEFRCYEVYLSSMYKSVFILTGTLFLPKERDGCKRTVRTVQYDLLERRLIAIPTNFFKTQIFKIVKQNSLLQQTIDTIITYSICVDYCHEVEDWGRTRVVGLQNSAPESFQVKFWSAALQLVKALRLRAPPPFVVGMPTTTTSAKALPYNSFMQLYKCIHYGFAMFIRIIGSWKVKKFRRCGPARRSDIKLVQWCDHFMNLLKGTDTVNTKVKRCPVAEELISRETQSWIGILPMTLMN